MTRVDLVTLQYGQSDYTVRFFESLRAHYTSGKSPSIDLRVIFVDNGSSGEDLDKALSALGDFPSIVIRLSKNLGFVRGSNAGVCTSDAPWIVLQNNDTIVFPGSFERLLSALESDPNAGVVGPLCSHATSGASWQSYRNCLSRVWPELRVRLNADPDTLSDPDRARVFGERFSGMRKRIDGMVAFFSAMFPRRTFEEVGLLSTDFGIGFGDDDDFCARIRKTGRGILLALDSYVYHASRTTFKANYSAEEITAMQKTNLNLFFKKNYSIPRPYVPPAPSARCMRCGNIHAADHCPHLPG